MAAFATPAELASHLQVASVDTASATQALNTASARIRRWCGWSISQETNVAWVLDGTGRRSLWLKTLLLTAVASVVEDSVTLVYDTDYTWESHGKLTRNGCWPRTPRSITATVTHGYAAAELDDVKGVCLALAGRLYQNPVAAKGSTKTAGPFTETLSYDNPSIGLTELEMEDLGPFKLEYLG